jgi:hypothetical protein
MRTALWLAVLWLGLFSPLQAQDATDAAPSAELRISLLTFAPGAVYWQRFGHNALLVENTINGANAVYNYGLFDFFQKNFFLNFARGHMVYRLGVQSLDDTLSAYAAEGRWVYQQVLALDAQQKLELAEFLHRNAQPDRREYRYDYFRDNCSTRVRDALDHTLGGALKATLSAQPVNSSYRFEATRLMRPILPLALGMDAIMGPAGDAPMSRWQQSFVPAVFMQAVAAQQVNGHPLVASAGYLLADSHSPVAPDAPLHWIGWALALGLGLGALLVWAAQQPGRLGFGLLATPLLLLAGLAGLFMLAAWTLTEHWAMASNYNLLLFSPLALLLIPVVWMQPATHQPPQLTRQGLRLCIWAMLIGAGLSALAPQQHWPWLALWLPLHAALAYGLLRRL